MHHKFILRQFLLLSFISCAIVLGILIKNFIELTLPLSSSTDQELFNIHTRQEKHQTQPKSSKPTDRTILFWNEMYGRHSNWRRFWFYEKENVWCPECKFTTDRSKLNSSDALLFHGFRGSLNFSDLPPHRFEHQRWVYFMNEPPRIPWQNLSAFNNIFNWSMTYRTDSDVFGGYGDIHIENDPQGPTNKNYANGKTDIAAWYVSHCSTRGKREDFVTELQKYIPVHIYGHCGHNNYKCLGRGTDKCYQLLEDRYKFYLSFENNLCRDYVTEKLFAVLEFNVVPVVFTSGRSDKFVPRSGYVDALDFKTPKLLAEYLMSIHRNDTLYNQFFEWKRGKVVTNRYGRRITCELCKSLSDPSKPSKTLGDIEKWWNEKSQCAYWEDNKIYRYKYV